MFVLNRALVVFVLINSGQGTTTGGHKTENVGIIGGHKVSIEEAPYVVSLRLHNGTYHWCGGSIIHEQFILSAAHCIVPHEEYKVRVGTDSLDEGGQLYDVEKIITHEKYSHTTNDYDVCILKLNENITFGPKVNKIQFTGHVPLKTGTMLNASGWGSERPNGEMSEHLQEVSIPVVLRLTCQIAYSGLVKITRRMICAGERGKDTCLGDSGGPLIWNNIQVGVSSFGAECGVLPGVYTKISTVRKWINATIEENL